MSAVRQQKALPRDPRTGSPATEDGVPATPGPAPDADLTAWRRITLEKQLPRPMILARLGAPAVVCALCLVLLALFTAVNLGRFSGRGVPAALTTSQRSLVADIARGLDSGIDRDVDELTDAADGYADDPGRDATALAGQLTAAGSRWRGVTVRQAGSPAPVVVAGEQVPVALLPAQLDRTSVIPFVEGDDLRLLVAVRLADGRLLAAQTDLRIRPLRLNPEAGQAVLFVLPDGKTVVAQGTPPAADDPVQPLLREVAATAGRTATSRAGATVDGADQGGDGPVAPVVTMAPVGDHGFSLASVVHAPVLAAGSRWQGLPAAAGLLLAAGLVLVLCFAVLVRPVHRLLDRAKAVAYGDPAAAARLVGSRVVEVDRLDAALAALDGGGATDRRRRGRVSAATAVLAATAVVVASAVGVALAYSAPARDLPGQIMRDSENRTASVATGLSDSLDGGLMRLVALARAKGAGEAAELEPELRRLVQENPRFRSVYRVTATGRPEVSSGREPLRPRGPVPAGQGLVLHDVTSRVPIVYAHTDLPDGRALVAEFDIRHLSGLLDRAGGRVRVLDDAGRTILDTDGYLAFRQVNEQPVRAAAAGAPTSGPASTVVDVGGDRTLLVSSAVAGDGAAAPLHWSVVAQQPVAEFDLLDNGRRRAALLVAVLASAVALLLVTWYFSFFVRPLRNLSRTAQELASGSGTGSPVHPRRHDDVGAVAVCLEITRQVAVHGEQRRAGAVRLRGTVGTPTVVMPRITGGRQR
jgi:HAMP domain-containing protein